MFALYFSFYLIFALNYTSPFRAGRMAQHLSTAPGRGGEACRFPPGRRLGLDVQVVRATRDDRVSFTLWAAASAAAYVVSGAVMLAPALALAAALWLSYAR
jgi:hypothetical protein